MTEASERGQLSKRLFDAGMAELGGLPLQADKLTATTTTDQSATTVATPVVVAVIAPAAINANSISAPSLVPFLIIGTTTDQHATVVATPLVVPVIAPPATLDYHATTVATPMLAALLMPAAAVNQHATVVPTPVVYQYITPPAAIDRSASTVATPSVVAVIAVSAIDQGAAVVSSPTLTPYLVVGATIDAHATTVPTPRIFAVVSTGIVVICATVAVEGGNDPPVYSFGATNSLDIAPGATEYPVLSIRPKMTYNGIVNRAIILPRTLFVSASKDAMSWRLVASPTSLTAASFTSVDTESHVDADKVASALVGGHTLAQGFLPKDQKETVDLLEIFTRLGRILRLDAFGTIPDTLTLAMTNEGASSATGRAALMWGEIR